jgi:hypothetical protein
VFPARIAKLSGLYPLGVLLLVFRRRVVAVFAIPALQRNDFTHCLIPLFYRTGGFTRAKLLDDFGHRSGAHGVAAFANREA